MCEKAMAVSECPWWKSTSEVSTITIDMLPWPAQFEMIAWRAGVRRQSVRALNADRCPAGGFGGGV